jgi:hypothetical protein
MDSRELRIWNYVDWRGERAIISQLLEQDVFFKCGETDLYDAINPILLTEEWHNNFGVKKDGFGAFEYKIPRKNNSNIKVIFNRDYVMLRQGKGRIDDDLIAIWNKDIKKRDMFVHEWQNLYFSLCGEELTFKNN